ncbi:hypothetical protein NUW58_g5868 [Xylaria curta]|uniref:Uncharacterized protein n=1 Tax=Xylaria curta TaxID=42375 RepID=A0ACC1P110_9PEZI|nr:hypothetical protein NUW58_g5868 [Xylaria curta]
MFANPIKPRLAPGYYDIILRPQDLKGIQKAITAGSKAAAATVANMPDVEPNSPAVLLPISIDLVPPRGIINIAQLERELIHMFANAIMYNPDPQRGLGPSFLRSYQSNSEEGEDLRGYEFDENGVVKETRNMFAEVEKLLGDLRNEVVPRTHAVGTGSRSVSAAVGESSTVEDDGGDEQAGDAKRRRIRDSEDEDEGEIALLPHLGDDFDRPEPEPLSPRGQSSSLAAHETSKQPTDATDLSLFANVYDNQQGLTVQQSNLIENIVRQSQRASRSSGDVSLPARRNGRKVNPSSGTDVTSPMALSKPRNHRTHFHDDVSELTTPRKSAGYEWEIPSSPETVTAPHRTRTGERACAEMTPQGTPCEVIGVEYQQDRGLDPNSTPMPVAKTPALSDHDSALPDTSKFYIAQSNLTTMQKLEFQKINVSANGYGGLPGSLPNHKSSGATTIAYSTPSGYSPVPPLPWEEPPVEPTSPHQNMVINISSSPDMLGSGFEVPNERSRLTGLEAEIPLPDKNHVSPGSIRGQTLAGKGKKRATRYVEEDELCRDDIWDRDEIDAPRESYKPRVTKRRSVGTTSPSGVGGVIDTREDMSDTAAIQTPSPSRLSPPPSEPKSKALSKKRGRKRKLFTENIVSEPEPSEDPLPGRNPTSPENADEAELPPEKPKKKRGRPRKSPRKAAETSLLEPPIADELPKIDLPQKGESPDRPAPVVAEQRDSERKTKRKKRKTTEEAEGIESKEDRLPLKDADINKKTPSKPTPPEESPAKTEAELNDETPTPKKPSKETPKPAPSQSKVTYRVGLSKRSRIAPLLKSIRK